MDTVSVDVMGHASVCHLTLAHTVNDALAQMNALRTAT